MDAELKAAIHALLNVLTIPIDAPSKVREAESRVRKLLYGERDHAV